jgi:hypothetical protein
LTSPAVNVACRFNHNFTIAEGRGEIIKHMLRLIACITNASDAPLAAHRHVQYTLSIIKGTLKNHILMVPLGTFNVKIRFF